MSNDDCVEIFLSVNPDKVRKYYTFEINAIGTMLNRCRTDGWTGPPTWEPEGVRYRPLGTVRPLRRNLPMTGIGWWNSRFLSQLCTRRGPHTTEAWRYLAGEFTAIRRDY